MDEQAGGVVKASCEVSTASSKVVTCRSARHVKLRGHDDFDCPCGSKFLSNIGSIIDICEFRRQLRVEFAGVGRLGVCATACANVSLRFDRDGVAGQFSKLFIIGKIGVICECAYAVAWGIGEATYARARPTTDRSAVLELLCTRERQKGMSYD